MIKARIPIRTHVITEHDDIVKVVKKYTGDIAEPGDIISVAESVVAIAQGRAILPGIVKVGFLARFLCRFPGKDGSLATPQAMQLAIVEAGPLKSCWVLPLLLSVGCWGEGETFTEWPGVIWP
ncbi:MAG: coenzyme F420-0:L-glutamate ligase [Candidatus Syntrophopropionicum ammoniitolerans]